MYSPISQSLLGIVIPLCVCLVQLLATPWTAACQVPLSVEFSRQEYWSGLPFPNPGIFLPHPGIEPASICHLHWQADSPLVPPGKPSFNIAAIQILTIFQDQVRILLFFFLFFLSSLSDNDLAGHWELWLLWRPPSVFLTQCRELILSVILLIL